MMTTAGEAETMTGRGPTTGTETGTEATAGEAGEGTAMMAKGMAEGPGNGRPRPLVFTPASGPAGMTGPSLRTLSRGAPSPGAASARSRSARQ